MGRVVIDVTVICAAYKHHGKAQSRETYVDLRALSRNLHPQHFFANDAEPCLQQSRITTKGNTTEVQRTAHSLGRGQRSLPCILRFMPRNIRAWRRTRSAGIEGKSSRFDSDCEA